MLGIGACRGRLRLRSSKLQEDKHRTSARFPKSKLHNEKVVLYTFTDFDEKELVQCKFRHKIFDEIFNFKTFSEGKCMFVASGNEHEF